MFEVKSLEELYLVLLGRSYRLERLWHVASDGTPRSRSEGAILREPVNGIEYQQVITIRARRRLAVAEYIEVFYNHPTTQTEHMLVSQTVQNLCP